MPETINIPINIGLILAAAGGVITIATAGAWILKGIKPIFRPFSKMKEELRAIEKHQTECANYFRKDKRQLEEHHEMLIELREDFAIIMEDIVLLMSHAETGNNTGEIAKGREKTTQYLIKKRGA
ncbi:MAG: hypothetical protein IKK92_10015 [Prevotella sp.]|nr:hypothetical protein [Prevotella sp.]